MPFVSSRKSPAPSGAIPSRDVDEVWERVRLYNEQRNALYDKNLKVSEIRDQLFDYEPPHDWQIVVCLGDWRMQLQDIYNRIVTQWQKSESIWQEHVRVILELMTTIGIKTRVLEKWKKNATEARSSNGSYCFSVTQPSPGKRTK